MAEGGREARKRRAMENKGMGGVQRGEREWMCVCMRASKRCLCASRYVPTNKVGRSPRRKRRKVSWSRRRSSRRRKSKFDTIK
eukprot:6177263-Pleurochrysis_carterae.AAC.2